MKIKMGGIIVKRMINDHLADYSSTQEKHEFEEEFCEDGALPPREVRLANEPENGDYDKLAERLSGEVITYSKKDKGKS